MSEPTWSAVSQGIVNLIYMLIVVKRLGRVITVVIVVVGVTIVVPYEQPVWVRIRVRLETRLVVSLENFNTISSHTTTSDISCIERVGDNKGVSPAKGTVRSGVPLERRCS